MFRGGPRRACLWRLAPALCATRWIPSPTPSSATLFTSFSSPRSEIGYMTWAAMGYTPQRVWLE